MKPFVMVTGDFSLTGGMDRANFALADYLARQGGVVHLVAHSAEQSLTVQPNVRFHRVAKPLDSYMLGAPLLARRGHKVGKQVTAEAGRVLTNGGNCCYPDVNWVHYVQAAYRSEHPASVARRMKQRIEYPLQLREEKRALHQARLVICNSRTTQQSVIERTGVLPERTAVVYYGSDATRFHPADDSARLAARERLGWPSNRPVAIFIGALGDRRKGFDTLFSAWSQHCKRTKDAFLVVVGRGAELAKWQSRAAEAGRTDGIAFLGFRSDVPDLLRAADLLIAPTRYEAYGLGVHEALCCDLPAITSATAGVAEQYTGACIDWLLPDPEDTRDLAVRIDQLIEKPQHAADDRRQLGQRLRDWTWDRMSESILSAIDCGK